MTNGIPLTLGFSSCPNDTFIFDALVNRRIDTPGFSFTSLIADVEELNRHAFSGLPEVTKVSFHAYLHLVKEYVLLNAGAALGRGCGPLLLSARPELSFSDALTVAIPGENTTANLLLGFAFPQLTRKRSMLFSAIEEAVIRGEADLGLVIHESRFTYAHRGLHLVADLGEIWEERTGSPIPLGGIIARRNLGLGNLRRLSDLIRESVAYAFSHPDESSAYIRSLARETEESVLRQHIDLYVNQFTLDLGEEGRNAVTSLFRYAVSAGIIREMPEQIFLD